MGYSLQTTLYVLMILFFTYFYTAVSVNIAEMSDNIKNMAVLFPDCVTANRQLITWIKSCPESPGRRNLSRIDCSDAECCWLDHRYRGYLFRWYGPLIVVGVALDTMKQVESLVLMRHYQGFMK